MKKTKFDLEIAEFQDDYSMKNTKFTDYSYQKESIADQFLLKHVLDFVDQCKNSIQKFLSLSQYGHGFNLFFYQNSINNFENDFKYMIGSYCNPVIKLNNIFNIPSLNKIKSQREAQEQYQILFQSLLRKMNHILKQFLEIEQFYEQNVLFWKPNKQNNNLLSRKTCNQISSPIPEHNMPEINKKEKLKHSKSTVDEIFKKFERSLDFSKSKGSTVKLVNTKEKQKFQNIEQDIQLIQQDQLSSQSKMSNKTKKLSQNGNQIKIQNQFRKILEDKLKPSQFPVLIKCDQNDSFNENMSTLQKKINLMTQSLKQNRLKQLRIQNIFANNRFKEDQLLDSNF